MRCVWLLMRFSRWREGGSVSAPGWQGEGVKMLYPKIPAKEGLVSAACEGMYIIIKHGLLNRSVVEVRGGSLGFATAHLPTWRLPWCAPSNVPPFDVT